MSTWTRYRAELSRHRTEFCRLNRGKGFIFSDDGQAAEILMGRLVRAGAATLSLRAQPPDTVLPSSTSLAVAQSPMGLERLLKPIIHVSSE
jgi:hypothetical protein